MGDFDDVTLAWEDEEEKGKKKNVWKLQVKVKVNDFNDMTLAWKDEVQDMDLRTSRKSESENLSCW